MYEPAAESPLRDTNGCFVNCGCLIARRSIELAQIYSLINIYVGANRVVFTRRVDVYLSHDSLLYKNLRVIFPLCTILGRAVRV